MTSVNGTICNYLFDRQATEVFTNLSASGTKEKKASPIADIPTFVDESLEMLLKVNRYILEQKTTLALLDPASHNNQCHLFALKAAQIRQRYNGKSEADKNSHDDENKFLHLSLFLSAALKTDKSMFEIVLTKSLKALGIKATPEQTKFMRDDDGIREKAARLALNRLFEREIKSTLGTIQGKDPLYHELFALAHENLIIPCGPKKEMFYTYPKLAGVAYFVDQIAKDHIPFVVKVKVLTKDGSAGVVVHKSREISDGEPAIVFEGFATDGTAHIPFTEESDPLVNFTVPDCMQLAKRCNTYFNRNVRTKERHSADMGCFYCRKATQVDLSEYKKRISEVMQSPEKMFTALGADFVDKQQIEFHRYFADTQKYPLLSALYASSKQHVKDFGLGMEAPSTFSVFHAYVDIGLHAKTALFQQEMTHEEFLNSRGVLCKK